MAARQVEWRSFLAEVKATGRFTKAEILPLEHGGNIATISGEVASRADLDEIAEMARQRGFLLLAQELFVPAAE